jgi:Ca2+-transporting ATPase
VGHIFRTRKKEILMHPSPTPASDTVTRIPIPSEGLTTAEATARLQIYGANELIPEAHQHWWKPFLHAITDPMVLLLLIAGTAYLLLREYFDGMVLLVALLPLVAMDLALELRAEHTLANLRSLATPRACVVRDGHEQEVSSRSLVPGDLVRIHEGDVIPADGILVEAADLQIDEAALTGESQPVTKHAGAPIADATMRIPAASIHLQGEYAAAAVFAGTSVITGHGSMIITATGKHTEYGHIGRLIAETPDGATPLQRVIAHMFRILAIVALLFCLGVIALELIHGHGWAAAILAGVSLAMAAIPEEFPIVFTLYLSLGVWRMARLHALVRRLAGVETLGSTTVICTDKTGTITQAQMVLTHLWAPAIPAKTEIPKDGSELATARRDVLYAALLASMPASSDPLDRAIAHAATSLGISIPATATLLHEYPFATAERLAAAIWQNITVDPADDCATQLFVKGAWERVCELLDPAVSSTVIADFQRAHDALVSQGLRVLAVARRMLTQPHGERTQDIAWLTPLGLMGFMDPLRPEVRAAIAECHQAGIRVIMLTGDHPQTALTIAQAVGLGQPGESLRAVTGAEIERASTVELAQLLATQQIFARVLPTQKYRIVQTLKNLGAVVAMTGDGINDAPALKVADVGVAMGQRGTEVARSAATMVLLDDNFATIVAAVREGRRIFDNLRRAFGYLIAFHLPIVLAALLVPLTGTPLFLLPIHLVWLELIVHPTSALVFASDEPDPALMQRPPRRPDEPLLTRTALLRVLLAGVIISAAVLSTYLIAFLHGVDEPRARTLAFTILILGQILLVLLERTPDLPIWRTLRRPNRWLPVIIAATLGSLVLALVIPGAQSLTQFGMLQLADWGIIGMVLFGMLVSLEITRHLVKCMEQRIGPPALSSAVPTRTSGKKIR